MRCKFGHEHPPQLPGSSAREPRARWPLHRGEMGAVAVWIAWSCLTDPAASQPTLGVPREIH